MTEREYDDDLVAKRGPHDDDDDGITDEELMDVVRRLRPSEETLRNMRPPRPVTVGRRRSDRWLAYLAMALMGLMSAFILYTSYQQNKEDEQRARSDADRAKIIEDLEQQNRDLLCFAQNTQAYQIATAGFLLAHNGDDPAAADARRDLAEVRDALRAAREKQGLSPQDLCFGPPAPK